MTSSPDLSMNPHFPFFIFNSCKILFEISNTIPLARNDQSL